MLSVECRHVCACNGRRPPMLLPSCELQGALHCSRGSNASRKNYGRCVIRAGRSIELWTEDLGTCQQPMNGVPVNTWKAAQRCENRDRVGIALFGRSCRPHGAARRQCCRPSPVARGSHLPSLVCTFAPGCHVLADGFSPSSHSKRRPTRTPYLFLTTTTSLLPSNSPPPTSDPPPPPRLILSQLNSTQLNPTP